MNEDSIIRTFRWIYIYAEDFTEAVENPYEFQILLWEALKRLDAKN